jgi:hypothetical protein
MFVCEYLVAFTIVCVARVLRIVSWGCGQYEHCLLVVK